MHDAHDFLTTLAIVLSVAALTTVVFQRLRQPVVFGYLFAGMIVGPHVPIPIVADVAIVQTLSETGVILLRFRWSRVQPAQAHSRRTRAAIVAVAQGGLMIWLGYALGRGFGWTKIESFYAGSIIAISSTTIIVKAFRSEASKGSSPSSSSAC